jgi:Tfp pilus assembly protein PilE
MAPLPLGRLIAQVIVPIVAVLARALPAAYNQALQNARRGGGAQAAMSLTKKLSKQEALQILNLRETEATAEAVQKVCLGDYRADLKNWFKDVFTRSQRLANLFSCFTAI